MTKNSTSSQNTDATIIQCPSCLTKFSVKSELLAQVEEPKFHCSRCDKVFQIGDLPQAGEVSSEKVSENPAQASESFAQGEDNSESTDSSAESVASHSDSSEEFSPITDENISSMTAEESPQVQDVEPSEHSLEADAENERSEVDDAEVDAESKESNLSPEPVQEDLFSTAASTALPETEQQNASPEAFAHGEITEESEEIVFDEEDDYEEGDEVFFEPDVYFAEDSNVVDDYFGEEIEEAAGEELRTSGDLREVEEREQWEDLDREDPESAPQQESHEETWSATAVEQDDVDLSDLEDKAEDMADFPSPTAWEADTHEDWSADGEASIETPAPQSFWEREEVATETASEEDHNRTLVNSSLSEIGISSANADSIKNPEAPEDGKFWHSEEEYVESSEVASQAEAAHEAPPTQEYASEADSLWKSEDPTAITPRIKMGQDLVMGKTSPAKERPSQAALFNEEETVRVPQEALFATGRASLAQSNRLTSVVLPLLCVFLVIGLGGYAEKTGALIGSVVSKAFAKESPEPVPAGIRLLDPQIKRVELDGGEQVYVLKGKIQNDSSQRVKDIEVEGVLFDEKGNIVASERVFASSVVSKTRLRALSTEMISKLQSESGVGALYLESGDSSEFTVILQEPEAGRAKHFNARLYAAYL